MGKHSFAYGVFKVGKYKSGPQKGKFYVQEIKEAHHKGGPFVDKATRKRVFKDVFGPKPKWLCVTMGAKTRDDRGRESEVDAGICRKGLRPLLKRDVKKMFKERMIEELKPVYDENEVQIGGDRHWDWYLTRDKKDLQDWVWRVAGEPKFDERPERKPERWVRFNHHGVDKVDWKE